jgi:hypothetical protein
MRLGQLGLGLALTALTALPASGALLVTEGMPNPSGTDADREWFEIYKSGSAAVDLTGYAVGDGLNPAGTSNAEAMGVFPDGTTIAPGQVFIIAIRNAGFTSLFGTTRPGLNADFEFANPLLNADGTSATTVADDPNVPNLIQKSGWANQNASIGMANGGDDFGIVDPSGTIVDSVSYGISTSSAMFKGWVDANSATIQRVPANADTDSGAEWVYVTGLANSTPGSVTVPEPASLGLVAAGVLLAARRTRRA